MILFIFLFLNLLPVCIHGVSSLIFWVLYSENKVLPAVSCRGGVARHSLTAPFSLLDGLLPASSTMFSATFGGVVVVLKFLLTFLQLTNIFFPLAEFSDLSLGWLNFNNGYFVNGFLMKLVSSWCSLSWEEL